MFCKANCKKYIAEFLGTALLVLIACGTWVFTRDLVATALAFGLVVVAMAYTIGSISGAHINPAVTLGVWINKKIGAKDAGFYMIAQVAGAIAGGAILFGLVSLMGVGGPGNMAENLYTGLTDPGHGFVPGFAGALGPEALGMSTAALIAFAIIVEVVLTFTFVFVILMVTRKTDNAKIAGLVIGLTLVLVHLFAIPLTGTSVNPARSIGSAVFAGTEALQQLWVFIIAPLAGAVLAALAARFVFCDKEECKEEVKK